jgi:site-specific DNA-methyltransferase (adenine-specific)/modification methylase
MQGRGGGVMKTELHNKDFREVTKDYKENYFDLCFTSPPYNMNLRINQKGDGYCSRQIKKEISTKYSNFSDNLPMDKYEQFLKETISECLRVSKLTFFNIQMITGNKPALFRVMGYFAEQIKEVIIWDKINGQPAIGDGVLNSQFEFILVLSDKAITRRFDNASFERGTLSNVWSIKRERSKIKNHGAVFPESLAKRVFGFFGFEGMKVFEPFLGSGTSAIAAHYSKASEFVGCEIDAQYFKDAQKRIEDETRQLELF